MFNFFRPTIKAKLVNGGTQVRVTMSHTTHQNIMVLVFLMIKQIAREMKIDHRHLLNGLKDIDTQIKKTERTNFLKNKYKK